MPITARSKIADSELHYPESAEAKEHRVTREALAIAEAQLARANARYDSLSDTADGAARRRFWTAVEAFTFGCYLASGLLAHDVVWLWKHAPWS